MKTRFKILHTESHRQWGGQERRIFNEARWMSANGHQIIIAAPKPSPLYEKARRQGWETHALPFNKFGMIKDACCLRSVLRNVRPDILNTHGNTDSKVGLVAAWGLPIPCVIRTRHSTPPVSNSWYNRLLYKRLCHLVFTTASCVTQQIHRDIDVPVDRIKTIPSGIDCPDDLIDHESARKKLVEEIGLEKDQRFIGFIGRLTREKGVSVLIEAFADIIKDHLPDHHLVVVGDGYPMVELQRLIRKRNQETHIHLLGYRDDPWPYFSALDCYVLASTRYEGVPQTILQAMFAGCPVVGTDVGGIPDIVCHEKTGLLVPPDNPRRLSEAILLTIESPESAQKRADTAFRYVRQHHTLAAMGHQILQVYEMHLAEKMVERARR